MQTNNIPPELEILSRIVDGQAPAVRELFQYALTMLMVEDGTAEVVERHVIDLREHLTFRTNAGDLFTIVKPDVNGNLLARMREMARDVLSDDRKETDTDAV